MCTFRTQGEDGLPQRGKRAAFHEWRQHEVLTARVETARVEARKDTVHMSISIGSDYLTNALTNTDKSKTAQKLQSSLAGLDKDKATDEEMLSACKDFEAYLVEQMIESMRSTVEDEDEEKNPYLEQFGDMQYQEYAKFIAESGQLGIAQQLYEAMKKN